MRQWDVKTCHDSLYQALRETQKTRDQQTSESKKDDVISWRTTKNHNIMTEAESAFSVSADSEARKRWSVNR